MTKANAQRVADIMESNGERVVEMLTSLTAEPYNKVVEAKLAENGGKFKRHEVKMTDGGRPLSFEEACRSYVHRFTKDHVPAWALHPIGENLDKYPAPHYASDKEWYDNTEFMGEGTVATRKYCRSMNESWPCGKFLDKPYPEWAREQTSARVRVSNKVSPPKKPKPVKPAVAKTKAAPKKKK